ncbi:serine/threonine-protein phosphatase pp2a-related [Anaeramoeba flamelloides]|uniref:Serine/threonine-protein phosphatase n=1 Tax=Anaeramoeba flamelloides TaxID=1746091 RepID=A0AAV7YV18_9EUKA|nr:serine/threonine-protein phosphatase pp2a-related [Anaeramoeba flamelloides]KAJ6238846.1 serine/threonine-protein phosphatase pp2a-related [Anaeramoeba flamelloides]
MDIDKIIEVLSKCQTPSEYEIKQLCNKAIEILIEEANVLRIVPPVTICGDIHGQFFDLVELFDLGGSPFETNYLFMGDFVDRGYYSLETFLYLLALKVKNPRRISLLRGNHECRQITKVYGFYLECVKKYGNGNVWRYCTEVFDHLSLTALIGNSIFSVHGGLSPSIKTINQISLINRKQELPHEGPMSDMLWSDPESIQNWGMSPRGAGFIFGSEVVKNFNRTNGLSLVTRAHQLCMDGFQYMFNNSLVTVWSAPNYFYRSGNIAAILEIGNNLTRQFKTFKAAPKEKRIVKVKMTIPKYFL